MVHLLLKEMLIYLAFPAAQGCAAEIDDGKSLISKPGEDHIFAAACAEKARMALFSVSLKRRSLASKQVLLQIRLRLPCLAQFGRAVVLESVAQSVEESRALEMLPGQHRRVVHRQR